MKKEDSWGKEDKDGWTRWTWGNEDEKPKTTSCKEVVGGEWLGFLKKGEIHKWVENLDDKALEELVPVVPLTEHEKLKESRDDWKQLFDDREKEVRKAIERCKRMEYPDDEGKQKWVVSVDDLLEKLKLERRLLSEEMKK